MKSICRIIMAIALLAFGFAFGFPFGKSAGFVTGSEWAIIQADLVAREAGLFMPVRLQNGMFRVTLKQPRGLHQKVRKLAEEQVSDPAFGINREPDLVEHVMEVRNTHFTR